MNSGIELKNTLACLTFIFLGARLFKNCLLGGGLWCFNTELEGIKCFC